MSQEQAHYFCPQCGQPRLFTRQGMNHVFHLLASLFLCGTWLIVWLLVALGHNGTPWFCTQCGYADTGAFLANPNLRRSMAQRRELEEIRSAKRWEAVKRWPHLNKAVTIAVFSLVVSVAGYTVWRDARPPAEPPASGPVPSAPFRLPDDQASIAELKARTESAMSATARLTAATDTVALRALIAEIDRIPAGHPSRDEARRLKLRLERRVVEIEAARRRLR